MDTLLDADATEAPPSPAGAGTTDEPPPRPISVRRRSTALVINVVIVCLYLLVGGLVVGAMESDGERARRAEDWSTLAALKVNGGASLASEDPAAKAFRDQLDSLTTCGMPRPLDGDFDWDFQGSIFFALTVVTTVGYGSYTPVTVGGRLFVIVYAVFGVSLIMTFIFQSAELYVMIVKGAMQRVLKLPVRRKAGVVAGVSFEDANTSGTGEVTPEELRAVLASLAGVETLEDSVLAYCFYRVDTERKGTLDKAEFFNAILVFLQVWPTIPKGQRMSVMLFAALCIAVWIGVWGAAIAAAEGWPVVDGWWFGFITLTTIGFGDMAPATHPGRMEAFVFTFVGLGFVAWLVQSIVAVWQRAHFWRTQRLYEKGFLSEKHMEVRGYLFKSPLGVPKRLSLGPFESATTPRAPTMSRAYQDLILWPRPKDDAASEKNASLGNDDKDDGTVRVSVDKPAYKPPSQEEAQKKKGKAAKGKAKAGSPASADVSTESVGSPTNKSFEKRPGGDLGGKKQSVRRVAGNSPRAKPRAAPMGLTPGSTAEEGNPLLATASDGSLPSPAGGGGGGGGGGSGSGGKKRKSG
eukprot:Rhum_TRINITY_DN15035_c15_g1::Rhum_TRINITY_DN15035_c15_g1_i1::g.134865::m.134865